MLEGKQTSSDVGYKTYISVFFKIKINDDK
jgi:hypothetical protein